MTRTAMAAAKTWDRKSFIGLILSSPAVELIDESGFFDLLDDGDVYETRGFDVTRVWMCERVERALNPADIRDGIFSQATGQTVVEIFCRRRILDSFLFEYGKGRLRASFENVNAFNIRHQQPPYRIALSSNQ